MRSDTVFNENVAVKWLNFNKRNHTLVMCPIIWLLSFLIIALMYYIFHLDNFW